MNPSIRAGLGTEVTGRTFFFIQSEMAIPGKGGLRTSLQARLWITGHAELDLFLFGPMGADPDSRTFGGNTSFVSDRTDHFTDATAGT
jgi:hypothetical protein